MPDAIAHAMTAPAAGTTIKEKLLADIRKGFELPDVLGKRHGLNGHDLVKNLEQLRKEGFIHVKWGAGDRIVRVKATEQANMAALNGHTKSEYGENLLKLSDAINRLPWQDGWRKYDMDLLKQHSGLKQPQIASSMKQLRETDKIVQLGGGHQGVPIRGVRWRGEKAPAATEQPAPVESVIDKAEAPSALSEAHTSTVAYLGERHKGVGFPKLTAALENWLMLRQAHGLLMSTGNVELAEKLAETPDYVTLSYLAEELERLIGRGR